MEEIQGLTDLQLQEADDEKERILAQLQELEKKVGQARTVSHAATAGVLPTVIRSAEEAMSHSHLWLHGWPDAELGACHRLRDLRPGCQGRWKPGS